MLVAGPRIKLGDVFTVPLDAERLGFGQVVARFRKDNYYFAIFDKAYPREALVDLHDVVKDRLALLALSLDAKIYGGDWKIVGNVPVPANLPLPAYKETTVEAGGPPYRARVDVVDYSGTRRRPAVGAEADLLPNRSTRAPIGIEKAFRALHGLEEWHESFEKLRPVEDTTTARLFP